MGSLHGQKTRPALQGRPQSPSYFLSRSKTHFRGQHTSYVRSTGNVDTTAASISSNPVQLGLNSRRPLPRCITRSYDLLASTDNSKPIPAQRHGQIPPRFGRRRALQASGLGDVRRARHPPLHLTALQLARTGPRKHRIEIRPVFSAPAPPWTQSSSGVHTFARRGVDGR